LIVSELQRLTTTDLGCSNDGFGVFLVFNDDGFGVSNDEFGVKNDKFGVFFTLQIAVFFWRCVDNAVFCG